MGKLNLSGDKIGDSPLTGFSVGEQENAWARKLHFYGIFPPQTVGSLLIEAKGPYY